ncbi:SDR family NAD(P)-dependent oxidoreductase [Craurococcus roseus]|uniref:SDR family NAD(P)-dependent oxidoreductase n=1 Tax=Craurococcus roseus TaxID=77585 RepID=A0ABP3QRV9_9PROT
MEQGIAADLEGKAAIVTGAGSRPGEGVGNGRAAAILLARAGARVVLADAREDWAEDTRRMIAEEGKGEGVVATGDVTKPKDCRRIVEAATGRFGRLDVLVNNVGVSGPRGTAEEVDLDAWNAGLLVNVTSMMLMAKFAVPAMRKAGGGAIVNIASVAGLTGGHPSLLYPTSKGAVVNMTRAMAVHHAKDGIRVNCVCPGMVYTPMVQEGGMSPELRDARRRRSVLQTEGSGWDVGAAVAFLASGNARWMTGAIVPVDAGATAVTAIATGTDPATA